MLRQVIDILRDIVVSEMELKPESVNIYNQRFKIPPVKTVFVDIAYLATPKTYRSSSKVSPTVSGFEETVSMNTQELYTIDIYSQDETALQRKEEVILAFSSVFSQQQQEKYSFKIAPLPSSFVDLCEGEGSSRLFRYQITMTVLAFHTKTKAIDYYDSYQVEVNVDPENQVTFNQPTEEEN